MARNNKLITKRDKEEIMDLILNLMADSYKEKEEAFKKAQLTKIYNKIKELEKFYTISGHTKSKKAYYNTKQGWASYVYMIKQKTSYNEAFKLIEEILDLLRGSQPIQLEVYKTEKNEKGNVISIKKYTAKETEVTLSYETSDVDYVTYLVDDIKKYQEQEEAFVLHYNKFKKMAETHIKKLVSIDSKGKEHYNINEGHILEAYRRHLIWDGHNKNYSEKITKKHVAIMMYYALNSAGWWTGGDVGYSQIKGDNARLASHQSIDEIATILIGILKQNSQDLELNTERIRKIKKLFGINALEDVADPEDLADKTLDEFFDKVEKEFKRNNKK